jgi:hypothetical protein
MIDISKIGRAAPGLPGRRIIVVHDGADLAEKIVSEHRMQAWMAALAPHADKFLANRPHDAVVADASEGLSFVVGQTTYTEAKVREKLYQLLQARDLMSFSSEAGEWADTIRYEVEDGVGRADWGSEAGDDLPYVDIKVSDQAASVAHGRIGYFYTLQELRQTAYLRRPLNERRLVKAQQAAERSINEAALYGIPSKGLKGFLNQTLNPQVACGNGAGSDLHGEWDNGATPDEIIQDINWGLNYVYTAMGFNFVPTDVGVPAAAWNRIVSTPRSVNSDTTVFNFLLKNNVSLATSNVQIKIRPIFGLDTAGAATTGGAVSGSNSRAVFWINNEDMGVCHLPMPLRFQPPQLHNLRMNVPAEQRFGGYELRYLKSMLYMDKVLKAG